MSCTVSVSHKVHVVQEYHRGVTGVRSRFAAPLFCLRSELRENRSLNESCCGSTRVFLSFFHSSPFDHFSIQVTRSRFSRISCSVVAPTRSLASAIDTIFPFRWIGFFFFFGILSSFNFLKLILKTFLLFLDCVLRDRFDPFELLPDFIYPS